MAKLIMGDTLHPGGLGLTNKLGLPMGLEAGDLVADLASAHSESAQALGRVFKCNVLGVDSALKPCVTPMTPLPDPAGPTSCEAMPNACHSARACSMRRCASAP
jgi:hypothetical protein